MTLSDVQGSPRPISSFGHGAQRSAHMALIKLLADMTSVAGGNPGGTIVLLIDEPELCLHPQAVELLRESLLLLSTQNFQVIFSTHSPLRCCARRFGREMRAFVPLPAHSTLWMPLLRLLRRRKRFPKSASEPLPLASKPNHSRDTFLQLWSGGGF